MKHLFALSTLVVLSGPALAAENADPEVVARIEAMLAAIDCQMDPADIEVEADGYDLDDVICKGGDQFDIKLDKDFNEISRRAE